MASCLKCGAKCAIHSLNCESEVMEGKTSIDCQTFKTVTIDDAQQRQREREQTFAALAVLRELRRQES